MSMLTGIHAGEHSTLQSHPALSHRSRERGRKSKRIGATWQKNEKALAEPGLSRCCGSLPAWAITAAITQSAGWPRSRS
jgi:hypothetical protein